MKSLSTLLVCLALIFTACSYRPALGSKDQVRFVRFFRDYGMTAYGADSVKLARPLQTLLGAYHVEYELTPSSFSVSKLGTRDNETRMVLFSQALSKADSRRVAQHLAATQPAQLAQDTQRCEEHPTDDGFSLNITLLKTGNNTKFNWTGSYDSNLMDLLDVVNKLAPAKYRFYEPGQQEAFKQAALHVHQAP